MPESSSRNVSRTYVATDRALLRKKSEKVIWEKPIRFVIRIKNANDQTSELPIQVANDSNQPLIKLDHVETKVDAAFDGNASQKAIFSQGKQLV